jgi:hypothetical protein
VEKFFPKSDQWLNYQKKKGNAIFSTLGFSMGKILALFVYMLEKQLFRKFLHNYNKGCFFDKK